MIPPRRPWSGWLDGGHLTLDVVVALVDGELADGPTHRALAHVDHCLSCAAEVTAQRQARRRLRDARMPGAPTSLLSSLRAIPDSAELPPVPAGLAVDDEGRLVSAADASATAGAPDPAASGQARPSRRGRRRLAIGLPAAVASGLAVGAVTLGTPGAAPVPPAATARPAVVPQGDGRPAQLGAQLTLRGDQAPGLPGPGAP